MGRRPHCVGLCCLVAPRGWLGALNSVPSIPWPSTGAWAQVQVCACHSANEFDERVLLFAHAIRSVCRLCTCHLCGQMEVLSVRVMEERKETSASPRVGSVLSAFAFTSRSTGGSKVRSDLEIDPLLEIEPPRDCLPFFPLGRCWRAQPLIAPDGHRVHNCQYSYHDDCKFPGSLDDSSPFPLGAIIAPRSPRCQLCALCARRPARTLCTRGPPRPLRCQYSPDPSHTPNRAAVRPSHGTGSAPAEPNR